MGYFIFDSDGTLLEFTHPIGDAVKIISEIRNQKKKVYVYSNNSKWSIEEVTMRYQKNGIDLIPGQDVITSAYITAMYIQSLPDVKSVYLIGSADFKNMLEKAGLRVVHWEEDIDNSTMTLKAYSECKTDGVDAVVVGGDNDYNFYRMCFGCLCVQNGAKFFVSENDPFFIYHDWKLPSSAFASYPIELTTGTKAQVLGKPSPFALELIMKRDGIGEEKRKRILMVGDSLKADIRFGVDCGIDTLLTLTGVTKEKDLMASEVKPKYVIDKLVL
eukprot:TRINITY_DN17374_c0_g2_i2.p1 TRINITY_DN17374_c0_g2~~TRINITY_DN17374_c0_g2_i2.p1  ORF type:complete len:273 (-),score=43.51 TRINITY_DN17374_c0_g2_i2:140-958(-)